MKVINQLKLLLLVLSTVTRYLEFGLLKSAPLGGALVILILLFYFFSLRAELVGDGECPPSPKKSREELEVDATDVPAPKRRRSSEEEEARSGDLGPPDSIPEPDAPVQACSAGVSNTVAEDCNIENLHIRNDAFLPEVGPPSSPADPKEAFQSKFWRTPYGSELAQSSPINTTMSGQALPVGQISQVVPDQTSESTDRANVWVEEAKSSVNQVLDVGHIASDVATTLISSAAAGAGVSAVLTSAGTPRALALTAGVAAGAAAALKSTNVRDGAKWVASRAIDVSTRSTDGLDSDAPKLQDETFFEGGNILSPNLCAKPKDLELPPVVPNPAGAGSSSAGLEQKSTESSVEERQLWGVPKDDMIFAAYEEPFIETERLIEIGIQITTVLFIGTVFQKCKPYLRKLEVLVRPHSTFLANFIAYFTESPFLNHAAGIRIFCYILLLVIFMLLR